MRDFRKEAEALRAEMVAYRRDFHLHPELGFEEFRTAGIVAQALTDLGLEVQTGIGKTGVAAVLEGHLDGPTVLVRCDMDALPILEENQTEYASQTPQKMHACGHDGHTAIGLALAKIFNNHRADLKGRIKFVFQPAEETGRGAAAMIKDGVLENPAPEVSLGLHLWNTLPVGEVDITPGAAMAGAAIFQVELHGQGGHGALPHQTADPVVAAAQIVTALQTIVSRNVSPQDTAVISVTQIIAGETYNVIPSQVMLKGTIRTFKTEVRQKIGTRFHQIVNGIAEAMGCRAVVSIEDLTPPLVNDKQVSARLQKGFAQIAPDLRYKDTETTMGAEDMAYFLEKVPGVFFFVGSANAERGLNYAHHHPRFDFDEDALVIGASLLASAVADYVLPD